MQLLDLTLPTAAENLALDEAMLLSAEDSGEPLEYLRLWEPSAPMVVLGRGSKWEAEVHVDACRREGVPMLRRCSGGLAIVAAPGCLMYAVVLCHRKRPGIEAIDVAHCHVARAMLAGLRSIDERVACAGTSDLAIGGRKFSGNSLRCKRTHSLYHGTLLYGMDLSLVAQYLQAPHRQPDYRAGRDHEQFLTQLDTDGATLRKAITRAWHANEGVDAWPSDLTARLVNEKYSEL